jgi:prepilin-type N-terminal cleavage/methylation domain-containing protein
MTKQTNTRGFTLIELLVVIAIIGILASVVLASLNSARDKGQTAAIKSSLNNMRAQAELYYDNNNRTYTGLCATLTSAQSAINSAGGTWACTADADEWAAQSPLVGTGAGFYCADYKGNATSTTASVYGTTNGDIDCD